MTNITTTNTNMKKGFTMIELIFVIVIIGILAAVAIPKLQGVTEDAEISKLQAYAGTLTRTIMPGVWSKSLRENNGGAIATVTSYHADINRDLPAPAGLSVPVFNNLEAAGFDFSGETNGGAPANEVATEEIDGVTYTVACSDGDSTRSPVCDVWDGTIWLMEVKINKES